MQAKVKAINLADKLESQTTKYKNLEQKLHNGGSTKEIEKLRAENLRLVSLLASAGAI
ncbi:MAG: hypothetical protein HOI53_10090 [Francisellaceae bacterium]|jgi:hypothetical protein|nr:hypothetical protein [Francisellaceae bacterium]